jgi:hypothetical protein
MNSLIVRFIRKSKWYGFPDDNGGKIKFKYHGFTPDPNPAENDRLETSCLERNELKDDELMPIGITLIGAGDASKVKGYVSFGKDRITEAGSLMFELDGQGHQFHGNILGWGPIEGISVNQAKDLVEKVNACPSMTTDLSR